MCWVALDRGIKIAEHYGFPADLPAWESERDAIRADVLANGYNARRQRFTMHYDTEAIDASLLQIPLVGFLPADDERVVNTVKAVEDKLIIDGLPRRYLIDDGHYQRVDYAGIRDSDYYNEFRSALVGLRDFDPSTLTTDKARIAFWTNLFNTLVIHAVVEHGIRESVKEAPFFFAHTAYAIGGRTYTLSDIEHGILRGNRKPPSQWRKRMRKGDPRLAHSIAHPDRRIHFALVCASRTCPPIEAYTAESLDEQLDTSAKVFINATTRLNRQKRTISISEIFKWYRDDFADLDKSLISWIADYLYNPDNAHWIKRNLDILKICHSPYDWRLNR